MSFLLGLIRLGSIGDTGLEHGLLRLLEIHLSYGDSKIQNLAFRGLYHLFFFNDHLLEHYIKQSCRLHQSMKPKVFKKKLTFFRLL